jgi:hypothetical protein
MISFYVIGQTLSLRSFVEYQQQYKTLALILIFAAATLSTASSAA